MISRSDLVSIPDGCPIILDTEATGLSPYHGHRTFAYSFMPVGGKPTVLREDQGPSVFKETLKRLWKSNDVLVMHNAKFDIKMSLTVPGVEIERRRPIHDTMVMIALVHNNYPHKLKELTYMMAGFPKDDEDAVKQYVGANGVDYSKCPKHIMDQYQERDVLRTSLLFEFLWPIIQGNREWIELYKNEIDLIWTTIKEEDRGLMIRPKVTRKVIDDLEVKVRQAREELPYWCKPSKSDDVASLLYTHLGLPVIKTTKKSKKPSTDKDTLHDLSEMFPDCSEIRSVQKYRSYSRGISMLESYLEFADEFDIIHPSINTCGAGTGRESCSNPNLQNVQKLGKITNPFPVPARKCFAPKPGHVNFHIDYSAIELILAIHYSQDAEMIRILNEGGDPHSEAASVFYEENSRWYLAVKSKIQKPLRDAAKGCHFGLIYGGGANKLAHVLMLDLESTKRAIERYRKKFPGIASLNRRMAKDARENGYITTAFGRKINIVRDKAYMALNYIIQGTAADILKYAQNRVDLLLETMTNDECGIVLPIHDELVIEVPRKWLSEMEWLVPEIRKVMIDFPIFSVPLDVEAEISTSDWGRMEPYRIAA